MKYYFDPRIISNLSNAYTLHCSKAHPHMIDLHYDNECFLLNGVIMDGSEMDLFLGTHGIVISSKTGITRFFDVKYCLEELSPYELHSSLELFRNLKECERQQLKHYIQSKRLLAGKLADN